MPLNLGQKPIVPRLQTPQFGEKRVAVDKSRTLTGDEHLGNKLSNIKKMQDIETGKLTQANKFQSLQEGIQRQNMNQAAMETRAIRLMSDMVKAGAPKDQVLKVGKRLGYTGDDFELDVNGPTSKMTMKKSDGSELVIEAPSNRWNMVENWMKAAEKNPEVAYRKEASELLKRGGVNMYMKGPDKEEPQSPLGKLIADRDALPEGDKRRVFYDRRIEKESSDSKDKNPTPQAALKRMSDIKKAKATLEKNDVITEMIAAANPELSDMIGQEIDPKLKQQLFDAWDDETTYLEEFAPKRKKEPVSQPEYKTKEDVKAAYDSGKISREEASKMLKSQFGME